jgi:phosphonate transport system substrate-binding protein
MRRAVSLALAAMWFCCGSGGSDELSTLRIGLLPGEAALTLLRRNEPLRTYLEQRLQMPVELIVGTDYAATGEALRFGRVDIAYLGPVTYVLQRQRAEIVPFAKPMHEQSATFKALIIVATDSPVKTLTDLHGENIAFGDVASTSGHWVPRYMLHEAGLDADDDYHSQFLGSHDAVALAVSRGTVAAGGISEPIFRLLVATGKIRAGSVRILGESSPIPEYTWTFRPGLHVELRRKIAEAFLAATDPAVLDLFKARSFVPARDEDYGVVRDWLRLLREE